MLDPNAAAFSDFGLTDSNNQTYIPNDSLDCRDHSRRGPTSGLSVQDANVLKIRVTYAYQLKVPLMQSVIKSVMCGFDSRVNAFGRGQGLFTGVGSAQDCIQYYLQGRVPIVTYATVQSRVLPGRAKFAQQDFGHIRSGNRRAAGLWSIVERI